MIRLLLMDGKTVPVRFHYRHWYPRLFGIGAITLGTHIYVRWPYTSERFDTFHVATAHECVHVGQWQRHPWTFLPRYVWQLLWRGYWRNRFEVEARTQAPALIAGMHPRLRAPWLERTTDQPLTWIKEAV